MKNNFKQKKITNIISIIDQIKEEKSLALFLQPIVNTKDNTIYGYEVLSRWNKDNKITSELPFKIQDIIALSILFEEMYIYPEGKLFINCSLSNLMYLIQLLENTKIDRNLVIELDFGLELFELKSVIKKITHLKKFKNVSVAIDDLGRYSIDPKLYPYINPDYLKVDISIAKGISKNKMKQKKLEEIVFLAKSKNSKIIIEGIETKQDADYLKAKEYFLIQGFYYYLPKPFKTFK